MSGKLNRHAYEQLIAEDIAWLQRFENTLERQHIEQVLRSSPGHEYALSQPPDSDLVTPDLTFIEKVSGNAAFLRDNFANLSQAEAEAVATKLDLCAKVLAQQTASLKLLRTPDSEAVRLGTEFSALISRLEAVDHDDDAEELEAQQAIRDWTFLNSTEIQQALARQPAAREPEGQLLKVIVAIEALHSREERIGGQRAKYLNRETVLDTIKGMLRASSPTEG